MATSLTKNKKRKKLGSHSTEIALAKDLIIPVADIKDYLYMLIYAKGGKGKTTFATSGARDGMKTLIIDFNEKGHLSVKRQPNTFVYRITHWNQLDAVYWYLKSGNHDFEVVVLDTVSSMAMIGMKWVLGDDASRDANRDPLMPDKRSWGKLASLLNISFSNWRNLDMHVIFTAHERTTEYDEEDEVVTIETHPALSPAPRENLISMVHIVGRIFKKEVAVKRKKGDKGPAKKFEWRMLIGDDDRYVTKLRQDPTSEVLIPRIVRNPTLKYFVDTILPELNKEQD